MSNNLSYNTLRLQKIAFLHRDLNCINSRKFLILLIRTFNNFGYYIGSYSTYNTN